MDFVKYHGTGNDFIIIDNRNDNHFTSIYKKQEHIRDLCHRRTGIGADGLIELKSCQDGDFKMIYYNSDGKQGTMCGNGGRCIAAYAWEQNIAGKEMVFEASDGMHKAKILNSQNNITLVNLKMRNVSKIKIEKEYILINTGSPHYVTFVDTLNKLDVYNEGKKIRSDKLFVPGGINVNFVQHFENNLFVRTFERGVEDETLSCGTGAIAAAIAAYINNIEFKTHEYPVLTNGGKLYVRFSAGNKKNTFEDVWLKGNAVKVFQGKTCSLNNC